MKRTKQELQEKLDQQLRLIYTSIDNFDKGLEDEALNLASRLKVLLIDTNPRAFQGSVLGQLGLKNIISFYDSSLERKENESINSGYNGLVRVFFKKDNSIKYIPLLDTNIQSKKVNFEERWNGIIFTDIHGNKFSRYNIVDFIANQDGGTHLDGKLKEKEVNFIKNNSLGFYINRNGKEYYIGDDKMFYAAIRQIIHELLKSLNQNYNKEINLSEYDGEETFHNFTINTISVDEINNMPRNALCYCGSNKKYKRCHGKEKIL